MKHMARFILALWWGAVTSIGFIVVPLLFMHLETPQMAGRMAAVLFNALDYIAWGCGVLLLATRPHKTAVYFIMLALLASVLMHFAIAPRIVSKVDLRLWHSLGTILYALQWLTLTVLHFRYWQSEPKTVACS
jgi:Domain of unknown function (DUF4149)